MRAKIKAAIAQGEDERRIIDIAKQANHAMFWSGGTDGWLSDDLRGY